MGFGFGTAGKNGADQHVHDLARRLRHGNRAGWRRRHGGHQHQAADAAAIGADSAVGFVAGGGGLRRVEGVADDADRIGGAGCCSARRAKARDQAGQCDRVSGSKRNDAPPQRPLVECLTHSPGPVPENNTLAANKFPSQSRHAGEKPGHDDVGVSAAQRRGGRARRARLRPVALPAPRAALRPASANARRGPFRAWRARRRRSDP
jgi:hypothetical protein